MLNDLKADLIDKKLWPVVVLLVAALIAVPLLLMHGGGSSSSNRQAAVVPPAGAAATTGAAGAAEQAPADVPAGAVTLAGPAKAGKENDRKGRHHDPFFVAPASPTGADGASTSSPAPASSGSGASAIGALPSPSSSSSSSSSSPKPSSGGSSAGSAPSVSSSGPSDLPAAVGKPTSIASSVRTFPLPPQTDFFFGGSGVKTMTFKAPARLTPVPSAKTALAYYGGVLKDRRTAVFIVAPTISNRGQGHCWPTPKSCRALELTSGQTAKLSYLDRSGKRRTYALKLGSVTKKSTSSFDKAVEGLVRTNARGAELLSIGHAQDELPGADQYIFYPAHGILGRKPAKAKAAASRK